MMMSSRHNSIAVKESFPYKIQNIKKISLNCNHQQMHQSQYQGHLVKLMLWYCSKNKQIWSLTEPCDTDGPSCLEADFVSPMHALNLLVKTDSNIS